MEYFDVIVVGAGPAGTGAAYHLAKNKLNVLILEKETLPRYKVCGGGLVYRGCKSIPFDISACIERQFDDIDIHFSPKLSLNARRESPIISMVMRDRFDALLAEKAIEAGAVLVQGQKITQLTFGEYISVGTNESTYKSKYVIAADGALSQTAKLAHFNDGRRLIPALECEVKVSEDDFLRLSHRVRFDMDAIPMGYGWCFPKKEHLSIGIASTKRGKIDLKAYYRDYLKKLEISNMQEEKIYGHQIPITHRKGDLAKNKVFLVGDAAGFADTLSAEGISNALYSSMLAASAIIESTGAAGHAEKLYMKKLQQQLLPDLAMSQKLAKLFYGNPKLSHLILKRCSQPVCDRLTAIFMGEKHYPKHVFSKLVKKLIGF